jgi:TPR repeat protein
MVEPLSASDPILPTHSAAAGSKDVAAIPAVEAGQPIFDVPPLVEPMAFADTPAEARPTAASHRPVRRRFLRPVATPASFAHDGSAAHDVRSRLPERPPLVALPADRGGPPATLPEASGPRDRPTAEADGAAAPARPRRWRRRLAVGAGVAAALALAVALEALDVGGSIDWLNRLREAVAQSLAGSPALPSAAGPPADPARRVAYYTERAEAGDGDAELALAILYAKGEGVAQDYAAAARWFRGAAEKGAVRAQYDLGVLYERGRGVPVDYAQAAVWYRKAAEQNHPLAQYNLAVAYTKGEGVRRDPFEAALWYHRAAAQGVVAAMVNLAVLYERGEGIDTSAVDAYAWYRAAARRGSVPAARRADELLQAFSPSDQTHAETKMAAIAASIHDAIGERARLAAQGTPRGAPAPTDAAPAPIMKSGIESGSNSTAESETGAENP